MSPHAHGWYLYMQVGPVRLWRCFGCGGERRSARAPFGRVVFGPVTFAAVQQ
jgi:hypothetical protein